MAIERNPHKIAYTGNSLYMPLYGSRPLRLLRVGGAPGFTEVDYFSYYHSDYSLGYDDGITTDGTYVYLSMEKIRTNICKFNTGNNKLAYYDLGVDGGSASAMVIGGGYLWIGTWYAGKIYRCNLQNPSDFIELDMGWSPWIWTYIGALEWVDGHLWVSGERYNTMTDEYTWVIVDILNPNITPVPWNLVWEDPTDWEWSLDLLYFYGWVFACFDTEPLKIRRFNTYLPYDYIELTGASDENRCYSLVGIDIGEAPGLTDPYVFAPTNSSLNEIRILRINPNTLDYDRVEVSGYYYGYGITKGGGKIWVSIDEDPAAFIELEPVNLSYNVYVLEDANIYRINSLDLKYLNWQIPLDYLTLDARAVGIPCVSYDGKSYIASIYVSGDYKYVRLLCISQYGEILWSKVVDTEPKDAYAYVSTPVVSYYGDKVYIVVSWYYLGANYSSMFALRVSDGAIVWQKITPEGFKYDAAWYRDTHMSQPAIGKDNSVYAVLYNTLYKLNPDNGSTIWTKPYVSSSCAPALSPDGNTVYAHSTNVVYAFDVTTGNTKWQVTTDFDTIYGITIEFTKVLVTGKMGTKLVGLAAYHKDTGSKIFTRSYDARRCVATVKILPPDGGEVISDKWDPPGHYIYVQDGEIMRILDNGEPYSELYSIDVDGSGNYNAALNPCKRGPTYPDDLYIVIPYCTNNRIRWARHNYVADILSLGRDERINWYHVGVAICKVAPLTSQMIFHTRSYIYSYTIPAEPWYTFQSYFATDVGSDITNRVNSDGSSPPSPPPAVVWSNIKKKIPIDIPDDGDIIWL